VHFCVIVVSTNIFLVDAPMWTFDLQRKPGQWTAQKAAPPSNGNSPIAAWNCRVTGPMPSRQGSDRCRRRRRSSAARSAPWCAGALRRCFARSPDADASGRPAVRCSRRRGRSRRPRAGGRVGVENIGRPLLDCRVRKQPRGLVHAARDHAHGGSGLA
jgi:hypothetical protein